MHLSLFSRLTLGYLAIFAIVAAASTYAIVELTLFGNAGRVDPADRQSRARP